MTAWAVLRSGWTELRQRPANQINALDGLRAIAVLLVIADHFSVTAWRRGAAGDTWLTRLPFVHFGWTGVDLFFVLSGFLIGRQVWQEKARTGSVRFARFFARRAFRIWPLYFATLALMVLFSSRVQPRWPDWFLLSNYFTTPYARSWSLSTEEMFYIFVPISVGLLAKVNGKMMLLLLAAALIGIDGLRYLSAERLLDSGFSASDTATLLYAPFHLHNQALLAGLLLSFLSVHFPKWLGRQSGRMSRVGLGVLVFCTAVGLGLRAVDDLVFSFTALGLIYGGLTYFLLRDDSVLGRPFGWKMWYPISRLSYGMYLNHLVFGLAGAEVALGWLVRANFSAEATFVAGLAATILISLIFAVVTFLCIEHPFLLLRARVTKGRA